MINFPSSSLLFISGPRAVLPGNWHNSLVCMLLSDLGRVQRRALFHRRHKIQNASTLCACDRLFAEVIMRVGSCCTKKIMSWVTTSSGCKQASHIWTVAFMPVTSVHLKAYISENKQKSQEKQQTFWDSWWITTASKINGEKFEIQMISECL